MRFSYPLYDPACEARAADWGECDFCLDALWTAAALWKLVDAARGNEIEALLRAAAARGERNTRYVWRFQRGDLAALLPLLRGLENALVPLVDEQWRIRPDAVAQLAEAPAELVTSWQEGSSTVRTLANAVHPAAEARALLERALHHDREIVVNTYGLDMHLAAPIPDPDDPAAPPDPGRYPDGWETLGHAARLCGLVDPGRQMRIEAVLDRARKRLDQIDEHGWRLRHGDVAELVELLEGLEPALSAYLDADWIVPVERVADVERVVPELLSTTHAHNAASASLADAVGQMRYLHFFLSRARDYLREIVIP